jgi:hypothetical protein
MLRAASSAAGSAAAASADGDAAARRAPGLAPPATAAAPGARRARAHSSSATRAAAVSMSRLDLDAAFFWLLLVACVTIMFFLNLRGGNVELNPSQVAEYERRTQVLSNSTVYIVEVHRPEGLLSKLAPADWARVSTAIDYVAYVYDDLPAFLADEWVARVERVLRDPSAAHAPRVRAGLGILLLPCGCVLPNAYFRAVAPRLGGMECLLLPGWVLPHGDVHWIPEISVDEEASCKRQKRIAASRVVAEYATELATIRRALERVRADLPGNSNVIAANTAAGVGAGGRPLLNSLSAGASGVLSAGAGGVSGAVTT